MIRPGALFCAHVNPPYVEVDSMTEGDMQFITIQEFCDTLRISRRTFDNLQSRGEAPPAVRFGRKVVMRREAVERWISDREEQAQAA